MFLITTMLILMTGDSFQLGEVGGKTLVNAQTAHGKTYLYYQQSATKFDLYHTDWAADSPVFRLVPQDPRIRHMLLSTLVATKDGLCIVSIGNRIIYVLDKSGVFLNRIALRDHLGNQENPYTAFPTTTGTILLTTKVDDHMVLYEFDPASKMIKKRHILPEAGSYHVVPIETGYLQISYSTGELMQLDSSFELVYAKSPLFELPERPRSGFLPSLRKNDSQLLRFPIYGAGQLTMHYQASIKGQKLYGGARFNGEQFVFSSLRPIAESPDGKNVLVFDYNADELRLLPVNYEVSESKVPPTP